MESKENAALLKSLPQVEEVLKQPALQVFQGQLPHDLIAHSVRAEISSLRSSILAGNAPTFDIESVAQGAAKRAGALLQPSLRRIINATGVVIHTNMGRAVMAPAAIDQVVDVMKGYSTLEYSVEKMKRGSRHDHCERLLCALTGAEAAIAVNNNAAAVVLVLSEFAAGHEAIVSRGELIELGGSFRIPDIMRQSNARMVEVGTTNKTHPYDYGNAITDETAIMLKVHKSNYRIEHFGSEGNRPEARKGNRSARLYLRGSGFGLLCAFGPLRQLCGSDGCRVDGTGRRPRIVLRRQDARRPAMRRRVRLEGADRPLEEESACARIASG